MMLELLTVLACVVFAVGVALGLEAWAQRDDDRADCTCDRCRALPDWDGGES